MKNVFLLSLATVMLLTACDKSARDLQPKTPSDKESYPFEFKGLLRQQGPTTYMYGTHVISGEGQFYALRSSRVNLDNYVGRTVTVKGHKVEGYPVENGPEYIDVKVVQ